MPYCPAFFIRSIVGAQLSDLYGFILVCCGARFSGHWINGELVIGYCKIDDYYFNE